MKWINSCRTNSMWCLCAHWLGPLSWWWWFSCVPGGPTGVAILQCWKARQCFFGTPARQRLGLRPPSPPAVPQVQPVWRRGLPQEAVSLIGRFRRGRLHAHSTPEHPMQIDWPINLLYFLRKGNAVAAFMAWSVASSCRRLMLGKQSLHNHQQTVMRKGLLHLDFICMSHAAQKLGSLG